MSCSNRPTADDFRRARLSSVSANGIALTSRQASRSQICRLEPPKQNAGTHKAFRRLNYAFLTLVGKGDAESRHSEILMVTSVTRLYDQPGVYHRGDCERNSIEVCNVLSRLSNQLHLVWMILLTKNKVPRKISH